MASGFVLVVALVPLLLSAVGLWCLFVERPARGSALRWLHSPWAADALERPGFPSPSNFARRPTVRVEQWGEDSLRIRWALDGGVIADGLPGALEVHPPAAADSKSSNILAHVADDGLVTVKRRSDGAVLLRQLSADVVPCSGNYSQEGCTYKAIMKFSSPPNQVLLGGGQHMNQGGIAGRLPPHTLQSDEMLPRLDMKGGSWNFESCTSYSHSWGAEICLPWFMAATPPELQGQALQQACGKAQEHTDQQGAIPVSDSNAEGIHATRNGCCSQCAALDTCDLWVHQPSKNVCWLLRRNASQPVTGYSKPDRTLGFKQKRLDELGEKAMTCGSFEYGMLWNMPNFGSMSMMDDATQWVAHDPVNRQIDVFITTHAAPPASTRNEGKDSCDASRKSRAQDLLRHYVDATGHAPMLPQWASGFWHSPMGSPKYNQSQVIEAANGLHSRGLDTDVFVIDYFNWAHMGNFEFDGSRYPDPKGMVDHLASLGMRLMVSAWAFSLRHGSRSSEAVVSKGLAVKDGDGKPMSWPDVVCDGDCLLHDPTLPATREFIYEMLQGYITLGIRNFWFDANEPENVAGVNHTINGVVFNNPLGQPHGAHYHIGTNEQVGMMYPWYQNKMIYEGIRRQFPEETPLTLSRSGWAGTQRFGAVHWNGDLSATWTNLKKTVVAGLNAQLSGIAWWTHDIGAINNCDNSDPRYRELLIRWCQVGAVTPIFRLHGSRPLEPWLLQQYGPCKGSICGPSGNATYDAIVKMMDFRKVIRAYVMHLMQVVHTSGEPLWRPLYWEFPADATGWFVTDQFMLGSRYMVAPVTDLGARARNIYFPKGACDKWRWYDKTGEQYSAGQTAQVPVPLDRLAMFECAT
eukprot:TRINITY_DN32681_c0_g1_i3.p1 TRINITY_DN32681_c0_g1~~TRINITY_DN32681_c0_g1_i3.p1  ORF type:complete len:860 (-),score=106.41 TRINITY_DN32681_c0_g1_i3:263-2842(-)